MPSKKKSTELPTPSRDTFNSQEMHEAAEVEIARLREKYGETESWQALTSFLESGRDAVGWKSIGRAVLTGSCER